MSLIASLVLLTLAVLPLPAKAWNTPRGWSLSTAIILEASEKTAIRGKVNSRCSDRALKAFGIQFAIYWVGRLLFTQREILRQAFRQEERKELPSPRTELRSGGSFGTIESSARMSQSS